MADDANDVEIDDSVINTPLIEQSTDTPPDVETPAQTDQSEATSEPAKEDTTSNAETTTATEETKEETPASETQQETSTDEQPQTADDRRRDAARQAWLDRQRRQEVEQSIDQNYGPKDANDLVEEGMDPTEAKVEALRQEIAFRDERMRVVDLNMAISSDATEVERDFDIFNPKSPNYNESLAVRAMDNYRKDANLEMTEDGKTVLRADRPLYDYMKSRYEDYLDGLNRGTTQAQQHTQEMLARTEQPGGSSSTNQRASDEDLEERIGNLPLSSFNR